jgi:hypothetical protein
MSRFARQPWTGLVCVLAIVAFGVPSVRGQGQGGQFGPGPVTKEQVEDAIQRGIAYLHETQEQSGAWSGQAGVTELALLALLTAGESPDEPHVAAGLRFTSQLTPEQLNSTYAIALQTMVYAAANPIRYRNAIAANVRWFERTQIRTAIGRHTARGVGAWTYDMQRVAIGDVDNSNSQYAVLGLYAAREAGIPIDPQVWAMAREYWRACQQPDGGWAYKPQRMPATASMTTAGISSLIMTGVRAFRVREIVVGDTIRDCGLGESDGALAAGIDWLGRHFSVRENFGHGPQWHLYYLYGLERAGRLTGLRYFKGHDWYREGAQYLVSVQVKQPNGTGFWQGDVSPVVSTSFALLFLAKGRAPVLVNKLAHGPPTDWNNDPDDVRNLVDDISRDWKHLLTWQYVDPDRCTVEDLLQAPIAFFNGHLFPEFGVQARKNLRDYVEQGGFLFVDACCSSEEFDRGFRTLMKDIFPEPEYELHPLAPDHAVWRSKHLLSPEVHPLWGIEHGCRTVVIYSPQDLSCFWNQMENEPDNASVVKCRRVGENVVDYATGRELPADKLAVREVARLDVQPPKRGALQIAKLRHAGDWNIAPLAIPNLTTALRDRLGFDVVINHREILPRDPNLINYPLLYLHGRAGFSFEADDLAALRRHLEPGGGTIFADAACGSSSFDAAFRRFVAQLLPANPLVPIPKNDELYTNRIGGYNLNDVQYTHAAGGQKGFPQLEGVKLNGHWAIIYSKYDIGCALERHQGADCKGYVHESALRIAANIVIYSTLP